MFIIYFYSASMIRAMLKDDDYDEIDNQLGPTVFLM